MSLVVWVGSRTHGVAFASIGFIPGVEQLHPVPKQVHILDPAGLPADGQQLVGHATGLLAVGQVFDSGNGAHDAHSAPGTGMPLQDL